VSVCLCVYVCLADLRRHDGDRGMYGVVNVNVCACVCVRACVFVCVCEGELKRHEKDV